MPCPQAEANCTFPVEITENFSGAIAAPCLTAEVLDLHGMDIHSAKAVPLAMVL